MNELRVKKKKGKKPGVSISATRKQAGSAVVSAGDRKLASSAATGLSVYLVFKHFNSSKIVGLRERLDSANQRVSK